MLKVNKEASGSLRVTWEQEMGTIRFDNTRRYPWEAKAGNVMKYFSSQSEALHFITEKFFERNNMHPSA